MLQRLILHHTHPGYLLHDPGHSLQGTNMVVHRRIHLPKTVDQYCKKQNKKLHPHHLSECLSPPVLLSRLPPSPSLSLSLSLSLPLSLLSLSPSCLPLCLPLCLSLCLSLYLPLSLSSLRWVRLTACHLRSGHPSVPVNCKYTMPTSCPLCCASQIQQLEFHQLVTARVRKNDITVFRGIRYSLVGTHLLHRSWRHCRLQ